jgi:hypothetical protein
MSPACYNLTPTELQILLASGWTVLGGPFPDQTTCLVNCGGGSGGSPAPGSGPVAGSWPGSAGAGCVCVPAPCGGCPPFSMSSVFALQVTTASSLLSPCAAFSGHFFLYYAGGCTWQTDTQVDQRPEGGSLAPTWQLKYVGGKWGLYAAGVLVSIAIGFPAGCSGAIQVTTPGYWRYGTPPNFSCYLPTTFFLLPVCPCPSGSAGSGPAGSGCPQICSKCSSTHYRYAVNLAGFGAEGYGNCFDSCGDLAPATLVVAASGFTGPRAVYNRTWTLVGTIGCDWSYTDPTGVIVFAHTDGGTTLTVEFVGSGEPAERTVYNGTIVNKNCCTAVPCRLNAVSTNAFECPLNLTASGDCTSTSNPCASMNAGQLILVYPGGDCYWQGMVGAVTGNLTFDGTLWLLTLNSSDGHFATYAAGGPCCNDKQLRLVNSDCAAPNFLTVTALGRCDNCPPPGSGTSGSGSATCPPICSRCLFTHFSRGLNLTGFGGTNTAITCSICVGTTPVSWSIQVPTAFTGCYADFNFIGPLTQNAACSWLFQNALTQLQIQVTLGGGGAVTMTMLAGRTAAQAIYTGTLSGGNDCCSPLNMSLKPGGFGFDPALCNDPTSSLPKVLQLLPNCGGVDCSDLNMGHIQLDSVEGGDCYWQYLNPNGAMATATFDGATWYVTIVGDQGHLASYVGLGGCCGDVALTVSSAAPCTAPALTLTGVGLCNNCPPGGSGSGSGAPVTDSICNCPVCGNMPAQWTFSVAGVAPGLADCGLNNGSFTLSYNYASSCVWDTPQFNGPAANNIGYWELNTSADPWTLNLFSKTGIGPFVSYTCPAAQGKCCAPTTFAYNAAVLDGCTGWPGTITINPVGNCGNPCTPCCANGFPTKLHITLRWGAMLPTAPPGEINGGLDQSNTYLMTYDPTFDVNTCAGILGAATNQGVGAWVVTIDGSTLALYCGSTSPGAGGMVLIEICNGACITFNSSTPEIGFPPSSCNPIDLNFLSTSLAHGNNGGVVCGYTGIYNMEVTL